MKIIDISQPLYPQMLVYPGDPHFVSIPVCSFRQGDACEVSELRIGTHCGTHIDAPIHMLDGAGPLETYALEHFVGPCRVLTLPHLVIEEKMLAEAQIKPGERILLRTDPTGQYIQSGRLNPASISLRAAEYLVRQKVAMIGIDSPSIENMDDSAGEVHRALLRAGIPILEGLVLHHVDQSMYRLSALPLHLLGENGSPCRAVLICE